MYSRERGKDGGFECSKGELLFYFLCVDLRKGFSFNDSGFVRLHHMIWKVSIIGLALWNHLPVITLQ
jgi:hypothetical protein